MHKFENYGINGSIHNWVSNLLMNQTMKVILDDESSDGWFSQGAAVLALKQQNLELV